MSSIKTRALVLRTRRFSESSLVVTLLGRECGRLDVLAKGCRREKSPLFGHLDVYQEEEVLVLRRGGGGLDLLTEAGFYDEHAGLRFEPRCFAAAGVLADLAAAATLPGEALVEFYDVLAGSLGVLSRLGGAPAKAGLGSEDAFSREERGLLVGRTVTLALLDMLGWLGFGVELTRCTQCGRSDAAADKVLGLGIRQGGLVCGECARKTGPQVLRVRQEEVLSLRERGEGGERHGLALKASERKRLIRFLLDYGQYVLDRPLRGRKVLLQMI